MKKLLADGGIRLSVVVSDLHGKSARTMIKGLLRGETPKQILNYASNRLKATEEELLDALGGEISPSHHFVITEEMTHIEELENRIKTFQQHLLRRAGTLFIDIAKLASWAGVCPGSHKSANINKSGKARQGNPHICRILCEAANAASRTQCKLQNQQPCFINVVVDFEMLHTTLGYRFYKDKKYFCVLQAFLRVNPGTGKGQSPIRARIPGSGTVITRIQSPGSVTAMLTVIVLPVTV